MLGGILSHSGWSPFEFGLTGLKLGLADLVITVTVFVFISFVDASQMN